MVLCREGEGEGEIPDIESYNTAESILDRLAVVANKIKTTPPKKRDLQDNQRYKALNMETMLLTTKLYVYHAGNSSSTLIQKRRRSRKRGEESKLLLEELCRLTSGNCKIKRFVEQYKCPSQ